MRINDLLNAFLYLDKIADPTAVAAIFPGLAVAASTPDDVAAAHTAAPAAAPAAAVQGSLPAAETAAGSRTVAAQLQAPSGTAAADTTEPHGSPAPGGACRAAASPANQLQPSLLVGDTYYAAKDELIHHEQVSVFTCDQVPPWPRRPSCKMSAFALAAERLQILCVLCRCCCGGSASRYVWTTPTATCSILSMSCAVVSLIATCRFCCIAFGLVQMLWHHTRIERVSTALLLPAAAGLRLLASG